MLLCGLQLWALRRALGFRWRTPQLTLRGSLAWSGSTDHPSREGSLKGPIWSSSHRYELPTPRIVSTGSGCAGWGILGIEVHTIAKAEKRWSRHLEVAPCWAALVACGLSPPCHWKSPEATCLQDCF